ncbi:hypothetical protein AMJ47_02830 [Parcubacteria bacterium DG_72]|nr:MAG: hypothetical protein AMJ47_02830 [Parcubacteria bacterium DG_72]
MKNKLIVIVGPTASGKTDLSIKLAKRFQGEIVSADSRQVYKGMDIGTGKVTKKEMQGIPHYLLDIVPPGRERFTVAQYKNKAQKAIKDIQKRNKLAILVGGTGFYIQAVVDGIVIPKVKPDWKLRAKLKKQKAELLFKKLKKLDPRRAETIDKNNKRRLIRALEIVLKTKKPVPSLKKQPICQLADSDVLILGLKKDILKELIVKRIKKMFRSGLEKEVNNLVKKYGWTQSFQTIGYQEWKDFFERKIDKNEVEKLIVQNTLKFAKRQITWFKRDKRIKWIKDYKSAQKLTKNFLKKRS